MVFTSMMFLGAGSSVLGMICNNPDDDQNTASKVFAFTGASLIGTALVGHLVNAILVRKHLPDYRYDLWYGPRLRIT